MKFDMYQEKNAKKLSHKKRREHIELISEMCENNVLTFENFKFMDQAEETLWKIL